MKFFHLSDLHLGKRVNGYPMLDDQKYILEKVIELIDRDHPDAVIIAGDVYDKSIPPVEAVNLFDDFLVSLAARGLQVFIISGNHDSAERVSYGGRVMEQSGIHISRRITGARGTGWTDEEEEDGRAGMPGDEEEDGRAGMPGDEEDAGGAGMPGDEEDAGPEKAADQKTGKNTGSDEEEAAGGETAAGTEPDSPGSEIFNPGGVIVPVRLEDGFGPVNVYLFPYIHPSVVREAWPGDRVTTWTDAMEVLIRRAGVDSDARNIAVAHQYITADGVRPQECDSEQKHIGGLDNVEYSVFKDFDYVALGHLHGPQRIGRDTVRYSGSPLKYSFSEEKQKKSVTVVELKEKGCVDISQIPLEAKRDLKTVRGSFEEVMSPAFTASLSAEDYYRVILTDEHDIDQALSRLRVRFYKNLMELKYDNTRTGSEGGEINPEEEVLEKEPIEVLGELYEKQNGTCMSEFQKEVAARLIEKIWN